MGDLQDRLDELMDIAQKFDALDDRNGDQAGESKSC